MFVITENPDSRLLNDTLYNHCIICYFVGKTCVKDIVNMQACCFQTTKVLENFSKLKIEPVRQFLW